MPSGYEEKDDDEDDLQRELDKGSDLALQLTNHLVRMGAAHMDIPITTTEGCFLVIVKRTL